MDGQFVFQCRAGECLAQQDAVSRDKPSVLCEFAVPRYKIRHRDAVAVAENDVIRLRACQCAVADCRGAKPPVFMPDMVDSEIGARLTGTHDLSGIRGGTVVSDKKFKAAVVLGQVAFQRRSQGIRAVVGRGNDGNAHF